VTEAGAAAAAARPGAPVAAADDADADDDATTADLPPPMPLRRRGKVAAWRVPYQKKARLLEASPRDASARHDDDPFTCAADAAILASAPPAPPRPTLPLPRDIHIPVYDQAEMLEWGCAPPPWWGIGGGGAASTAPEGGFAREEPLHTPDAVRHEEQLGVQERALRALEELIEQVDAEGGARDAGAFEGGGGTSSRPAPPPDPDAWVPGAWAFGVAQLIAAQAEAIACGWQPNAFNNT